MYTWCHERLDRLAHLGSEPAEETERLFHSATSIHYTGVEDFARQVEQSMKAQEAGIRALIQAIEKGGLPAPDVRLRIVPEVSDQRQQPAGPLPVVAPREFGQQ